MSMPPIRHFGGAPSRVLIAGGGVGALEALMALRALGKERLSIEVVAPEREFVYQPLSVLEPFHDLESPRFDVAEIAVDQGARMHLDSVEAVDVERRAVRTAGGHELRYDVLVVAIGATCAEPTEGTITFGSHHDSSHFAELLLEVEHGLVSKLTFVVPPGPVWALPLYELALNTSAYLQTRGVEGVELTLTTPEDDPLGLFGSEVSDLVRDLLVERDIEVRTGSGDLASDGVVTMPRLEGPHLDGLPEDEAGFIPIDEHCCVHGISDVYAVGDATCFPIKHGAVTAEQADAAAEAIASRAGAPITPRPFQPLLRGPMLTGGEPRNLSPAVTRKGVGTSELEAEALWSPPSKIPGRFLASYLRERGTAAAVPDGQPRSAVPYELLISSGEVAISSNGTRP